MYGGDRYGGDNKYGDRRGGDRRSSNGGGASRNFRDSGERSFAPVKVGDELTVKIEAVGEKGDGIAKKDGFVLFVPNTSSGEEVKIKVTKVLRKVGFAEVVGRGGAAVSSKPAGGSDDDEESYDEEESDDTEESTEESSEESSEESTNSEESEESDNIEDSEDFGDEEEEK